MPPPPPPLSPPSPGDRLPKIIPSNNSLHKGSTAQQQPFVRRQTLLDSTITNVAVNKLPHRRQENEGNVREIALSIADDDDQDDDDADTGGGGPSEKGGGRKTKTTTVGAIDGGRIANGEEEDDDHTSSTTISVRCKRKIAGFRLFALLLLLIGLSPIWLAALLVQSLMRLVLYPAVKIIEVSMPEFIRLWYIHKVGCLHSKIAGGWRRQHGKRPHSRPIRIDVHSARRNLVSIHTIAQFSDNIGYLIVNRSNAQDATSPQQNQQQRGVTPSDGTPKHGTHPDGTPTHTPTQGDDGTINKLQAVLIDCGDAKATHAIVESIRHVHYSNQEIQIEAVLTTHHHWDHQGGNSLIVKLYPSIETIVGGIGDRVSGCNFIVRDKQRFEVAGLEFESIAVPCHTRGSMVYRLIGENKRDCLFLGDTLFIGGCGACFEGTAKEMQRNFAKILLACQLDSLLFPGHEYTERILMEYFPGKAAQLAVHDPKRFFCLCAALCKAHHLRALPFPAPTVPVRLRDEVMYNVNFEPALKACIALKLAVSRHKQGLTSQRSPDPIWGAAEASPVKADPMGTSPVNSAAAGGGEQRCCPQVAVDGTGGIVVVEPPWISDGLACSNPILCLWRQDYNNLLALVETLPPHMLRASCLSSMLRLRDEGMALAPSCSIRNGRKWDLPKSRTETEELLKLLSDRDSLSGRELEQILNISPEITNGIRLSFQDMDHFFASLVSPAGSPTNTLHNTLFAIKDIARFVHKQNRPVLGVDAEWLGQGRLQPGAPADGESMKNLSIKQSSVIEPSRDGRFGGRQMVNTQDSQQHRMISLRSSLVPAGEAADKQALASVIADGVSQSDGLGILALTNVLIHDFTACRICGALPITTDVGKAVQYIHGGEVYSNRKSGLTTLITAADSSNASRVNNLSFNKANTATMHHLLSHYNLHDVALRRTDGIYSSEQMLPRFDTCPQLISATAYPLYEAHTTNTITNQVVPSPSPVKRAASYPTIAGTSESGGARTSFESISQLSKTILQGGCTPPHYKKSDDSMLAFLSECNTATANPRMSGHPHHQQATAIAAASSLQPPAHKWSSSSVVSISPNTIIYSPSLFLTVPAQSRTPPGQSPQLLSHQPLPLASLGQPFEYTIQIDSPKSPRLPRQDLSSSSPLAGLPHLSESPTAAAAAASSSSSSKPMMIDHMWNDDSRSIESSEYDKATTNKYTTKGSADAGSRRRIGMVSLTNRGDDDDSSQLLRERKRLLLQASSLVVGSCDMEDTSAWEDRLREYLWHQGSAGEALTNSSVWSSSRSTDG